MMTYDKTSRFSHKRRGMTLIELLISMSVGAILSLALSGMLIATYHVYGIEMSQNQANWRCQLLLSSFCSDVEAAHEVVSISASGYTLPGGTYVDGNGLSVTSLAGGDKALVLETPSYDASNAIISGSFDFISYTWTAASDGTGTLTRTCVISVGSSRTAGVTTLPVDGTRFSSMSFLIHDYSAGASSASADTSSLTAADMTLTNVDQVYMNATVEMPAYTDLPNCTLMTGARMRNWRLLLN